LSNSFFSIFEMQSLSLGNFVFTFLHLNSHSLIQQCHLKQRDNQTTRSHWNKIWRWFLHSKILASYSIFCFWGQRVKGRKESHCDQGLTLHITRWLYFVQFRSRWILHQCLTTFKAYQILSKMQKRLVERCYGIHIYYEKNINC
jgi:hypothetical protein